MDECGIRSPRTKRRITEQMFIELKRANEEKKRIVHEGVTINFGLKQVTRETNSSKETNSRKMKSSMGF